jgi:hypothetical protein
VLRSARTGGAKGVTPSSISDGYKATSSFKSLLARAPISIAADFSGLTAFNMAGWHGDGKVGNLAPLCGMVADPPVDTGTRVLFDNDSWRTLVSRNTITITVVTSSSAQCEEVSEHPELNNIPSGELSCVAIDTGTIGTSPHFYRNSRVLTNYLFSIACSTTRAASVAISFGGQTYSISLDDSKLAQILSGQCLGAIFVFTGPSSGPGWIVGDAFLKNVYSVFRANPASVGFATLAADAQSSVT